MLKNDAVCNHTLSLSLFFCSLSLSLSLSPALFLSFCCHCQYAQQTQPLPVGVSGLGQESHVEGGGWVGGGFRTLNALCAMPNADHSVASEIAQPFWEHIHKTSQLPDTPEK